jgi:hypothetical protein
MRTMKITTCGTMAVFATVLMFAACKRDKTNNSMTPDEDAYYAEDQARMDQTYDDAQSIADQAYDNNNAEFKGGENESILGSCATVTRDTTSTPRKITIDFGTSNCPCKDGRYRRGKVVVTYTGKYRDPGSSHTISFDGYYVNDNAVLGYKTVENKGKNSSGQTYFNITVDGMIILNSTGDTIIHKATRVRTWTVGENTLALSDDEYSITGSGTNTRRTGKVVNYTITNPLIVALNCRWIKQGTVEFTPAGASTVKRTIDFGSGMCDDQATVTIGTRTKTITLR